VTAFSVVPAPKTELENLHLPAGRRLESVLSPPIILTPVRQPFLGNYLGESCHRRSETFFRNILARAKASKVSERNPRVELKPARPQNMRKNLSDSPRLVLDKDGPFSEYAHCS
jgi:hypothetical protein